MNGRKIIKIYKKRIRISVITDNFYTLNVASAVRVKAIVDALINTNKFDITIFTTKISKHTSKYNHKTTLNPPPSNKSNYLIRLFNEITLGIEFFFRLFIYKNDLILVTSPPFFMTLFCIMLAKIIRIPYIIDVRDIYPDVYFSAGVLKENGILGNMLSSIEKKIYNNSFLTTTVTRSLVNDIKNKMNYKDNVLLLRNGFINKNINLNNEKFKTFTIVCHGNIGKFQDVGLILKLAERFNKEKKDIEILVIGSGSEDYLIKNVSLTNLKYFGKLDYYNVYNIISKAHLGISFRKDDIISRNAFPVKIYEFIGVGIPVIVTPISEAGEFVENNKIGFQFSTNQFNEIFSTIIYLKENQEKLKKLSENILKIRGRFSREKIAKNFAEALVKKIF